MMALMGISGSHCNARGTRYQRVCPAVAALWAAFLVSGWAATPVLQVEPMANALAALKRGDFPEAERWFSMTRRDFSDREVGAEALVHETLLVMARELSCLRLSALWREAGTFARLEGQRASTYSDRAKEYEERAREAAAELAGLSPGLLAMAPAGPVLRFSVGTEGWEVTGLRTRLEKGALLEKPDSERLEKGERVINYIGLLSAVAGIAEEAVFAGPVEGTVRPPALFGAVGVRLYLANERSTEKNRFRSARACFEKVVQLTEGEPYDKQRLEAKAFLAKMPPGE